MRSGCRLQGGGANRRLSRMQRICGEVSAIRLSSTFRLCCSTMLSGFPFGFSILPPDFVVWLCRSTLSFVFQISPVEFSVRPPGRLRRSTTSFDFPTLPFDSAARPPARFRRSTWPFDFAVRLCRSAFRFCRLTFPPDSVVRRARATVSDFSILPFDYVV